MTKPKKIGFQPGQSGNPNGRPKGGTGKPISRLRSTLNKLKDLEPDAIEVIKKALDGVKKPLDGASVEEAPVDKARVDTAKWIITSIASLTRTAIAEETYKLESARPLPEQPEESETTDVKPVGNVRQLKFSTQVLQEEE